MTKMTTRPPLWLNLYSAPTVATPIRCIWICMEVTLTTLRIWPCIPSPTVVANVTRCGRQREP
jgi:hypothetical protein